MGAVRPIALGMVCPRCKAWVLFQKDLEGLPTVLEGRAADRRQIVAALVSGSPVFKKIEVGTTSSWFAPVDIRTLARRLHMGVAVADLGYDIHLVHPCKVAPGAVKAHNGANKKAPLPANPPF